MPRRNITGRTSIAALLSCGLAASVSGGCADTYTAAEVNQELREAIETAQLRRSQGDDAAVARLLRAVHDIDPAHPNLLEAEAAGLEVDVPSQSAWLGTTLRLRERIERPTWARVALYPVDRALDLLDILSFDVHFGPGAYVNVHYTRAAQVGAGARAVAGIGWHHPRSLGGLIQTESEIALPVVGTQAYWGAMAGTSGLRSGGDAMFGLHRPTSAVYQNMRDYWAVGAHLTVVLFGVDVDWHPVEIADLLAGLVGVDFLRDDFATTRGVDLRTQDEQRLERLAGMRWSSDSMEDYRGYARARAETEADALRPLASQ